jgi:plasmid stabilization system protein ParE
MNRKVIVDPKAAEQLEAAYRWWAEHRSMEQSIKWYNGFLRRLRDLRDNPEQFPLAAEDHAFPYEVRELHYGLGGKSTHRALFTIRPDMVYVFSFRHAGQKPITPDDL